ncbi:LLM class flavin-dependent oxidoreductase [Nocardia thraciensis]
MLNLPLRPPSVLARAAASLDLLSDGRVEMGLGAGAFWALISAPLGRERGDEKCPCPADGRFREERL